MDVASTHLKLSIKVTFKVIKSMRLMIIHSKQLSLLVNFETWMR